MAESTIKITAETKEAESRLKTLGEHVQHLDERFIGLGDAMGTLGAAVVAGGLVEMIKGSLESADAMGKMASKAGVSVESFSRLSVAAQLADVDAQSLAAGMGKLSKNMVEAQGGTGPVADAFKQLGISVNDANGKVKSADQVMVEVADRFSKTSDGAGKTAAAMAIFGKAGADLIPLLNGGSEEMDRMAKLADQLGLTLDGATSATAQNVNDRFATMGLALKGIGMTITKDMLPTLDSLSSVMVDTATNAEGLQEAADSLSFLLKSVVSIGMGVVFTFKEIGDSIGGVDAASSALAHGDMKAAGRILKDMSDSFDGDVNSFSARMDKLWAENAARQKDSNNADSKPAMAFSPKSGGGSVDPNDTAVLALQNEEFKKQMDLLGVSAAQVKVYELAMKGATESQIREAQSIADSIAMTDAQIKSKKQESDALKYAEEATLKLGKAREQTLGALVELDTKEQLRRADMLTGIEREHAISDIQVQIAQERAAKELKLQMDQIDNEERLARDHHALSADLERKFQEERLLQTQLYEARLTDAKNAESEKRMKSELSVANFAQNLRHGDYMNAMNIAEQMTAGLATKSRAAFEVNKAAALAKATVQGYQMVQAAAADGASWGGYVGAIAEGALAFAYSAAQIQAINSTQFGGGSGGISAGGGGIPSLATSPGIPVNPGGSSIQQQQPVSIQVHIQALEPNSITDATLKKIADSLTPALQQNLARNGQNVAVMV